MTDAERAAEEILQLFTEAQTGAVFVNPRLFEGKTQEQIRLVKERVRQVIDRHMC